MRQTIASRLFGKHTLPRGGVVPDLTVGVTRENGYSMKKKNQEELSLDKEVGEDQRTLLWNDKTDAQSEA